MERCRRVGHVGLLASALFNAVIVFGSACGGDTATASDAGATPDGRADDLTAAGGAGGQGGATGGGGGIVIPQPDHFVADYDAGRECAWKVVARDVQPPADQCRDAGARHLSYACLPRPPEGNTCADTYNEPCILHTYSCGYTKRAMSVLCGPVPDDGGNCCYLTAGDCSLD